MSGWDDLADTMLATDGPAALVCRQYLMPAEGHDAVIFPPTFAAAEGGGGKAGYNIDALGNPADPATPKVAIIDTVGAQANRMEPLFKANGAVAAGDGDPFPLLVPQIEIKAGNKTVNLLDAGHRAADAIVRYSTLGPKLKQAFETYQESGDATELAKIAPTSLVFGAWDSRDTQVKLPRLVASTIRAYNVVELKRSAQYNPPVDYIDLGLVDDADDKKVLDAASELGFRHAPAAGTHGGVMVRGDIRRDAILSLVALRTIGPQGAKGEALRRYVLGLALVAMTHGRPHNLRQGCLLVGDPDKPAAWELVGNDGTRKPVAADPAGALGFAQGAAKAFGVGKNETVEFDGKAANAAIKEKVGGKAKGRKGG
ncbi:type I-U CRISPR-associated protein Cas7 [Rhodoplanes serenus]|uniref:Type I-U CRISPR-associated protein Cas7 n=1 Tax=Rhodoplanes serenus TaxID=200615 RepID=A0A9X4XME9_9BRAD|nr:type I-U CRISPR-associated RAMP protein Csb1/Cas7u [Rhodoplanes serenus]MTW17845.1 type I-U CRISPR-associated protein Cas7 [Rhodoplanes serenus]